MTVLDQEAIDHHPHFSGGPWNASDVHTVGREAAMGQLPIKNGQDVGAGAATNRSVPALEAAVESEGVDNGEAIRRTTAGLRDVRALGNPDLIAVTLGVDRWRSGCDGRVHRQERIRPAQAVLRPPRRV